MITLRLFVICTDRGQHQRARLGELMWFDTLHDEWVGGSNILSQHLVYVPQDAEGVRHDLEDRDRGRLEILCPRCRRHIQWREETATEVITRMCADSPLLGTNTSVKWRQAWLDISHVP
jgi:hypothetical protein